MNDKVSVNMKKRKKEKNKNRPANHANSRGQREEKEVVKLANI